MDKCPTYICCVGSFSFREAGVGMLSDTTAPLYKKTGASCFYFRRTTIEVVVMGKEQSGLGLSSSRLVERGGGKRESHGVTT